MKFSSTAFAVLLPFAIAACGMPKSSYTTSKARVLKVYTTVDAGHKYIAYVIDRGGTEVVVADPLARSSHKVGDTIEYLDQKIELQNGNKSLSFTLLK